MLQQHEQQQQLLQISGPISHGANQSCCQAPTASSISVMKHSPTATTVAAAAGSMAAPHSFQPQSAQSEPRGRCIGGVVPGSRGLGSGVDVGRTWDQNSIGGAGNGSQECKGGAVVVGTYGLHKIGKTLDSR